MQCETCQGSGEQPLPSGEFVRAPCGDCGGSGISHCCDGIQEQRDPKRELEELSAAAFAKCEETYVGPGRCDRPEYLQARYEYQTLMVKRGLLHSSEMDAKPVQEQRDPGDETAEECQNCRGYGIANSLLFGNDAPCPYCGGSGKARRLHENPIIDALLTEASDAALETLWADQLGEMERDVTGCADDCCHPDHNHLGAPGILGRQNTLAVGEVNAYAVGITWFDQPLNWRQTLEKAREFNALPDAHDEWRKLNDE